MNTIRKVELKDISMSDPYILADPQTKMYYMTGTGGRLWKSADLKTWEGPYAVAETDPTSWMGERPAIWAAEIHYYEGKYYFFGTFTNDNIIIEDIPNRYKIPRRASHVLVADKAEGPYRPMSNEPYTDEKLATLDGTLWVENGTPYMIYCHEWVEMIDGTMELVELKKDLSAPVGDDQRLFCASAAEWSTGSPRADGSRTYVTDGCFLYRTKTGKLLMVWSSFYNGPYAVGIAESDTGKVTGPWRQQKDPLYVNGGHSMIFRDFEGHLCLVLHSPNSPGGSERAHIYELEDLGHTLKIKRELSEY